MEDIIILRNKIIERAVEVYACHPETYKMVVANKRDLPSHWIVYPNPFTEPNVFDQADLNDPVMEDFIFKMVLPNYGFVKGEKN